jgi:hypothetical protein
LDLLRLTISIVQELVLARHRLQVPLEQVPLEQVPLEQVLVLG